MGRRKKKKPLKLNLRTETLHSIVAVVLIAVGLLVIVSLTGQGALLAGINNYLSAKLGAALLFLPFVFISSGMVMFRTKWMWSKPHVLLGTVLLMFGFMGTLKSGEIGANTFTNVSNLITPAGTYVVFGSLFFIGSLIITQLSIHEFVELLNKLKPAKKVTVPEQDSMVSDEEIKKAKGFSLPKLGFSLKKTAEKGFSINKGAVLEDVPETEAGGTAIVGKDGVPDEIKTKGKNKSAAPNFAER
jgi:hypothetical protein